MSDTAISSTTSSQSENQGTVTVEMEGLIKNHIQTIDKLREEAKTYKQMIDETLNNDSTYKDHADKAKEAARIKTLTKKQIMGQPAIAITYAKLKDSQYQIKDLSSALSEYLREFARLTGTNEIEGLDGEVREIVVVAKVVKKSSKASR